MSNMIAHDNSGGGWPSNTEARGNWHRLQLHADDAALTDNICRFLFSALSPGHAAIMAIKREHLGWVRDQAPSWDLDLPRAEAEGRLVILVAEDVPALLLVDGLPDRERFQALVQGIKARITAPHQQLHIYGEVVGMLLEQGNESAMHALEELWNEFGAGEQFTLLCGYPAALLASPERMETLHRVCDHHDSLLGGAGHLVR